MNKQRRKQIREVMDRLEKLKEDIELLTEEIETIHFDEEEYRDNIPENLQNSERYEAADSACSSLEDAESALNEAGDNLDTTLSSLEEAYG